MANPMEFGGSSPPEGGADSGGANDVRVRHGVPCPSLLRWLAFVGLFRDEPGEGLSTVVRRCGGCDKPSGRALICFVIEEVFVRFPDLSVPRLAQLLERFVLGRLLAMSEADARAISESVLEAYELETSAIPSGPSAEMASATLRRVAVKALFGYLIDGSEPEFGSPTPEI